MLERRCEVPPKGWRCTRVAGHEGPCAAVPNTLLGSGKCPLCEHEWSRHDPEDGRCDAHTALRGGFGPCPCGRDLAFMQREIALQSSAALLERFE